MPLRIFTSKNSCTSVLIVNEVMLHNLQLAQPANELLKTVVVNHGSNSTY